MRFACVLLRMAAIREWASISLRFGANASGSYPVAVQIVKTSVVDVYTAILASGAFLVLNRFHRKLTVLYVVLGCGAIGGLLQLTVV